MRAQGDEERYTRCAGSVAGQSVLSSAHEYRVTSPPIISFGIFLYFFINFHQFLNCFHQFSVTSFSLSACDRRFMRFVVSWMICSRMRAVESSWQRYAVTSSVWICTPRAE